MRLKKTKEGMVVMSKDRLTEESKWPHHVNVVCEKGLEASSEQLRYEACEAISKKCFPVEDASSGSCIEEHAVDQDLYKEINFFIKPKEGEAK